MSRLAVATCAGIDVDPDSPLLLDALDARGIDAELVVWDDPRADWASYELVVVRSTWDYAARLGEFLAWARRVPRLLNPFEVIAYSTDKHYLADLAAKGLPIVDSTFCDVGSEPVFPPSDFVVKPCVGAGSIDADRYRVGETERARAHVASLHERGGDALIQPYVDSVDEVGERGLIFIDGEFSHAMTKSAMLNVAPSVRDSLFRSEQMSRSDAEPEALTLAARVLEAFGPLLYARVDLVGTSEGWAIMELELVEPSLFLAYDANAAGRLAEAIARRL